VFIQTRFASAELNRFALPVTVRRPDRVIVAHAVSGEVVAGLHRGQTYHVEAELPGGQMLTTTVAIPWDGRDTVPAVLEPGDSDRAPTDTDEVAHFMGAPAKTLLPAGADTHQSAGPIEDDLDIVAREYARTHTGHPERRVERSGAQSGAAVTTPRTGPGRLPEAGAGAAGAIDVQVRLFRGDALAARSVAQPVERLAELAPAGVHCG
jgi:hypothetical protein